MQAIELEDFHEDILAKAMRGKEISKSDLACRTGLEKTQIERILNGLNCEKSIHLLSEALGLDSQKMILSAQKSWLPEKREIQSLQQFNLPFGSMKVNMYLIWDCLTREALLFDVGPDHCPIVEFLKENHLNVKAIFLTHSHRDHIACIDDLLKEITKPPIFIHELESFDGAKAIQEGFTYSTGRLSLESFHTHGHSAGGMTYLINGLEQSVAIVGDAIFAGSMGGGMVSYEDALRTNREKILSLPNDTILCPGHGPITTVKEEKFANPFFPEFQNVHLD